MNKFEKEYLIDLINNDKPIPDDMKYVLFPTLKEEYELAYAGKMRKEDILANEDGTFPLPLQVERLFSEECLKISEDDWKNLIVFGDNLQFLKTIYENRDPLIKDKVNGKIKLIYIDPPFATQDEFNNSDGAKAYNDKKKGAEFIEFLRRRLIVAREILADDGYIAIHLDQKMNSYIRIVLDEVFGKNNMVNELIWRYFMGGKSKNFFSKKHDTIYIYQKSGTPNLVIPYRDRVLYSKPSLSSENNTLKEYEATEITTGEKRIFYTSSVRQDDVFEISGVFNMSNEYLPYPTQKPEQLLKEIILSTTKPGDIVLDFFGGSGTTMAAAEKLDRRWITCDLGKLSYFTMQRRLLNIADSKDLEKNESYSKKPKSFITCKLGMYDLKETLSMDWEKYKNFVSQLFEFELKSKLINGVNFDGMKKGYPVKIFDYDKHKETKIDDTYLASISNSLGMSAPSRVYIVSPATRVLYLADYEEIKGTKFYFLNVPYEMINELHKTPFVKFRQPKSKTKINMLEEMKGFQFIDKPEVNCKLIKHNEKVNFVIDEFLSYSIQSGIMDSFSTLSSIYVNYENDSKLFVMDDVRFWDEIESSKKKDSDTWLVKKNSKVKQVVWSFNNDILGECPMFIISDIFGNDFIVKPTLEDK